MKAVRTKGWPALLIATALLLSFGSTSHALFGGDDVKFPVRLPSEVNIETAKTMAILPIQGDQFHRFNDSLRVHIGGRAR